jgi:hypothetical protein
MAARINANFASKSSQNSSSKATDETQQAKALSPSNELNSEPDTQFSGYFNLDTGPLEGQGALPFSNNPPLTSPELTQDWEYWLDIADNDDIFNPVDVGKSQTVPYFSLSALNSARDPLGPNVNGDNTTPGTSPASPDAVAEISNEQQYSTAESLEELNSKIQKVRSHNIANERPPVLDDVTRQITSRLGRLQIAEDGQPRYYGATSNLHLLHSGPRSLIQPNIRHVVIHGDAAIAQAGLQWTGDPAYENLLISLFFSWHNALMYVVDRAIFLRERQLFHLGQTTDHYSPALENAVYVHRARK